MAAKKAPGKKAGATAKPVYSTRVPPNLGSAKKPAAPKRVSTKKKVAPKAKTGKRGK